MNRVRSKEGEGKTKPLESFGKKRTDRMHRHLKEGLGIG